MKVTVTIPDSKVQQTIYEINDLEKHRKHPMMFLPVLKLRDKLKKEMLNNENKYPMNIVLY